jgi:hypothetical protein
MVRVSPSSWKTYVRQARTRHHPAPGGLSILDRRCREARRDRGPGNSTLPGKTCIVGIIKGVCSMRFFIIIIAMSLSTLASGSTAIAQKEQPAPAQPTQDQAAAEIKNPSWYRESAPYRPCPAVATINGRDVCLGCPGRCPWPPSFGK